ncbi:hypothetical protein [Streptomyces sp. NPDC090798]|uniref:hypothetical protein n=1 Tax=Streptomyces sp. NPDC090798 TaxID=3365968 RepID=UPI0038054D8D
MTESAQAIATSTPSSRDSPPWDPDVIERHVHRIKMLKRQLFGRAGFAQLHRRVGLYS